jgi:protein LSM12
VEGQNVYDSLSKILPCFWKNENIIVMDTISIKPPYNLESISGNPENSLLRVKKIVEGLQKNKKK